MRTRYQYKLLLCDREPSIYQSILSNLPEQGGETFAVQHAATVQDAVTLLEDPRWDMALIGEPEGAASPLSFLRLCAQHAPDLPLVLLLAQPAPALEAQALDAGAADTLPLHELNPTLLARVVRYTVERRYWKLGRAPETPPSNGVGHFELLSKIQDAIIALDQDFTLTAWNPAAEELYGWSAGEVLGRKLFDVIRFSAPRAEIAKALNSFVRSGAYKVEVDQFRRDGTKISVVSSVVALFGQNGQIEGYILQNRDVSKQKQAQEERNQILDNLQSARQRAEQMASRARQNAEEMEAVFQSLVDAVLIYDMGEQPIRANRAAREILGFDPTGPDWAIYTAQVTLRDRQGSPLPRASQPARLAQQGESTRSAPFQLVNPDGKKFSLLISASPLFTNGQVSGAAVVLHDNTEQEQLISSLEAERTRLSTIFANTPNAIVLTDPKGNVILTNPSASLDYFHALFDPMRNDFEVLHPDGQPLAAEELPLTRSVALGESHINMEMAVRKNNNHTRYFLASTSPIIDRKGQISGALGVFQDITQRKKTEDEIRRQLSTTEIQHYLTQYRDQEHLNIAHDLHDGPLQEIIGLSFKINALMYQAETEKVRSDLEGIYELAQTVAKEVRAYCNDLRPPTLGRFGLDKTIHSYTEKLRPIHPNIQFFLNLESNNQLSNEVRIALFRIYKELIKNVIRHSNATQVRVNLSFRDQEIQLEVHDNGTGFDMPQDWVDLARNGHLGLVGVRERAESINGRAEVISNPQDGTRVFIRAPLTVITEAEG